MTAVPKWELTTDEQSGILLAEGSRKLKLAIHHRPLTFTRGRQLKGRRGCQHSLYPSIRTSAASGRAGAKLNSYVFFCFSYPVATAHRVEWPQDAKCLRPRFWMFSQCKFGFGVLILLCYSVITSTFITHTSCFCWNCNNLKWSCGPKIICHNETRFNTFSVKRLFWGADDSNCGIQDNLIFNKNGLSHIMQVSAQYTNTYLRISGISNKIW